VLPEGLGKFKNSPHRESTPLPSGLYHGALTTTLGLPSGFFPGFSSIVLLPIRATCHAYLILIVFMLGEEYKSRISVLCSFLNPPITLSLFSPNNLSGPSQYHVITRNDTYAQAAAYALSPLRFNEEVRSSVII
jgi:hypothetical protein